MKRSPRTENEKVVVIQRSSLFAPFLVAPPGHVNWPSREKLSVLEEGSVHTGLVDELDMGKAFGVPHFVLLDPDFSDGPTLEESQGKG